MEKPVGLIVALLIVRSLAVSQDKPIEPDRAPLLLVQDIPLPNVGGRIDHFTFDAKRKRVIGAALGNNTVLGRVFGIQNATVFIWLSLPVPGTLRHCGCMPRRTE